VQTGKAEAAETTAAGSPASARGPASAGGAGRMATGIARGALLIAGLTAVSRVLGLGRTLVFSQSVGSGCLGTAYVTANQVPNLIYELALGGALTSAMVPVLARSAARASADPEAKEHVARICSALLTWGLIILVPLTLAVMAAAHPIATMLVPANQNSACARSAMVGTTTTMLIAFAPQVFFYGVSVVLFGVLYAYRRFTGPTLAPVIANFVMIGSYLGYAALDHGRPLGATPLAAVLVLSIGTTLNIATLVFVALPPALRLRLRLRPTLAFPSGVMRQVGGLALVGILEFVASDVASVITIELANGHGTTGALVLVNYASLVFSSIAAVFALSIVTSAFPVLSATDGAAFDRTCAGSTRSILLMSGLGTAVIVAVAIPAAHILTKQPEQVTELTQALILGAPAVAGQGVVFNMSRVMFALGRLRAAALGLIAISLLGAVISVPMVVYGPPRLVVAFLALGTSVAQLVVAVPMVLAIRRVRGQAAVEGVVRATLASLAACAAGSAVGLGVTLATPADGKLHDIGSGALGAAAAIVAFGVVACALDGGEVRAALLRVRRLAARVRR
jgi:putative peptidoglycan lipid II flippase